VIKTFDDNNLLGMLSSPPQYHSVYWQMQNYSWDCNSEAVSIYAKELNLKIPVTEAPAAPYGTVFWFRAKALKSFVERGFTSEDFPEEPVAVDGTFLHTVERILPFVVQENGFYPAYAQDTAQMQTDTANYRHLFFLYNTLFCSHKIYGNSLGVREALEKQLTASPVAQSAVPNSAIKNLNIYQIQDVLDAAPLKLFIKKLIKRFFPFKKLWKKMHDKKWKKIRRTEAEKGKE
jgi:rhamnosyltransferase